MKSLITSQFVHSFSIYKWPIAMLKMMKKALRNFICIGSRVLPLLRMLIVIHIWMGVLVLRI